MKVSHALKTTHVIFVQLQQKKLPATDIHDFEISTNDLWEVAKGWRLGIVRPFLATRSHCKRMWIMKWFPWKLLLSGMITLMVMLDNYSVWSLFCCVFPSFGCQASSKERFIRVMFVVGGEQWNHQIYVFDCLWALWVSLAPTSRLSFKKVTLPWCSTGWWANFRCGNLCRWRNASSWEEPWRG